jgi:hypothetical protein
MTPSDNAAEVRRIMGEVLLAKPLPTCVHNFFNDVASRCAQARIAFDGVEALEYWSDLIRMGVVGVPGGDMGIVVGAIPRLIVTRRGRALLERGEQSPHDPVKFLQAVRRRVRAADEIALAYLNEAVGAWAAGLNRASAVMLGCACERLVLLLAQAVATAGVSPWDAKLTKELQAVPTRISVLFEEVRKCLLHLAGDKKLPGDVADALDRKLSAIFDHARAVRNKSGHPTGADVSADDAEAGLLLFPGFYAFVDDLCRNLPAARGPLA